MFTFIIPRVPGSVHRHLDTLAVDRGLDWAGVQRDRQVETLPSARPPHKPDDQRSALQSSGDQIKTLCTALVQTEIQGNTHKEIHYYGSFQV